MPLLITYLPIVIMHMEWLVIELYQPELGG